MSDGIPGKGIIGFVEKFIEKAIQVIGPVRIHVDLRIVELVYHHHGSICDGSWPMINHSYESPDGLLGILYILDMLQGIAQQLPQVFASVVGLCMIEEME